MEIVSFTPTILLFIPFKATMWIGAHYSLSIRTSLCIFSILTIAPLVLIRVIISITLRTLVIPVAVSIIIPMIHLSNTSALTLISRSSIILVIIRQTNRQLQ